MSKLHSAVAIASISTEEQMATNKKAVAYARTAVSTITGYDSLKSQLDTIRTYAEKMGIEIVDEFLHQGSGAGSKDKFNRFSATKLVDACRSKGANQLLVTKPDRLSRSVVEFQHLLTDLERNGVEVKFCNIHQDSMSDPARKFMQMFSLVMSEFDSKERVVRCKQGIENAAKDGRSSVSPPLGYKKGIRTGIYEPDDKFKTLQRLFKLYASGNLNLDRLAAMLVKEKVRNRNGNTLVRYSLKKCLRNPYYAGFVCDTDKNLYQGLHRPLLTEEEFEIIQTLLEMDDSDTQTQND